jgi:hypothetical protein
MENFREADLNDPAVRAKLLIHHPLLKTVEVLMTPPIRELYLIVSKAIKLREPGCCFIGPSGVGKTSALWLVDKMLRAEQPKIAIFMHETQNQQMPSVRAFFKNFLNTVNHKEKRGETYDLRLRVTNRLVDDARASGLDMAILLIDEAHAMSIQDFLFLKDVDNSLNGEGIKLVTIMMGQCPDFDGVLRKLRDQRRLDLIARFTIRQMQFRAYSTVEDLAEVFGGIDDAIFPPESTVTWTQFFFPSAYAAGFRMKNEAPSLYGALRGLAATGGEQAFPARQTFLAIRAFMVDNAAFDSADMRLRADAWRKAIEYAQVQEAMLLMKAVGGDLDPRLLI